MFDEGERILILRLLVGSSLMPFSVEPFGMAVHNASPPCDGNVLRSIEHVFSTHFVRLSDFQKQLGRTINEAIDRNVMKLFSDAFFQENERNISFPVEGDAECYERDFACRSSLRSVVSSVSFDSTWQARGNSRPTMIYWKIEYRWSEC